MESARKNQRNLTADVLKGWIILGVLISHSNTMLNSLRGVTWQGSFISLHVTAYAMPLFIMISGYFLWFSLKKRPHIQVLKKRIVSIGIPILIWAGIPAVIEWVTNTVNNGFSLSGLIRIGLRIIFTEKLYFLPCLLVCTVLVVFVDWLMGKIKNKKASIAIGAVIYCILILGLHCIRIYFHYIPFLFPYFLLGYLVSKYSLLNKKGIRILLYGLSILFFVLYPFYKPENSYFYLSSYILKNTLAVLPPLIHRFVLGLCGSALFYTVFRFLCQKAGHTKPIQGLAFLGTKTLELYIISSFVQHGLKAIAKLLIQDVSILTDLTVPLLLAPIFLVLMTAACLLINYLLEKLPKLHKFLFVR
jgi:fucose 4-O-acetylase-like acetyltransferase